MTKIFNQNTKSLCFGFCFLQFVQFMSSITQIIVTCAFSVLACVLRCTVQINKEKAVNSSFVCFLICYFVSLRRVYNLVFWLFLFRQINASVTESGIVEMKEATTTTTTTKGIALKFYFLLKKILN